MRRFSRVHRSQSWSAMSIDSAAIDAATSASNTNNISRSRSPARSTRSSASRPDYDTGFSAPFCGSGNTTWRHPAANTSPDFCISSGDIDVDRVYSRRRTFLSSHKNKRTTLSHGKLNARPVEYNNLSSIVEAAAASPTRTGTSSGVSIDSNDSSRISKDSHDGFPLQQTTAELSRPSTSHSAHHGSSVFRKLKF